MSGSVRPDGERLAVLEREMIDVKRDMTEIKSDVKTILGKFNEMTGGKKALFALAAFAGGVVGILGTFFAILAAWPWGKH